MNAIGSIAPFVKITAQKMNITQYSIVQNNCDERNILFSKIPYTKNQMKFDNNETQKIFFNSKDPAVNLFTAKYIKKNYRDKISLYKIYMVSSITPKMGINNNRICQTHS